MKKDSRDGRSCIALTSILDKYLDQYGMNEYKDFNSLTISVDDLLSTILDPEPGLEPYPLFEPDPVSVSRALPSS